jgi:D-alanyl-D-alanine dipeptidase
MADSSGAPTEGGSLKKLSLAEPVTELRKVPIVENGEPLVDFTKLCPGLLIDRPRFHYRRETLLRDTAARMLCKADSLLPKGYRLAVVEGWRPPHIQRRMYGAVWKRFATANPDWSETRLKRVVNQFTAPLNTRVPPPHSTGGAVDLTLVDANGHPYDVRTPYELYDSKGYYFDAPGLSEEARKNRRIMADALLDAGMTNYPSEYWHWTYGDQGWAYRGWHKFAHYGSIMPPGYSPDPADDVDEPLEFIPYP